MFQKTKLYFYLISLIIGSTSIIKAETIPFQQNFNSFELQFGTTLTHFISELSKDKFSKSDLQTMQALEKKALSFTGLLPTLDRIQGIGTISDQDTFYKECKIVTKGDKESSESLEERLNMNLDKYCRYLFLNRLSKMSFASNFSSRDINYLKEAAYFYITGENQEELINFFKNFKPNKLESEKISSILEQKYIEYKIRPSSTLLAQMHISSKFNSFLQMNINLDDKSSLVFQKEYQRIMKEAGAALDRQDFSRATKLVKENIQFYQNNKNFIEQDKAWSGLIGIAKNFFHKGRDSEAREFFEIAKEISTTDKFQESLFYSLWPAIITNDNKELWSHISKMGLDKSFDQYDSKLQYWIAYAMYKNGDTKKAFELFGKIISSTPYSFYSILSLKQLALNEKGKLSEKAVMAKLINNTPIADYPMERVSDTLLHALKRLAIWQKIDNERFVKNEVRFIRSLKKEDVFHNAEFAGTVKEVQCRDFLTLNLVRLLNSKNQFLSSFKVFQDSLEQNSLALNFKLIKYIFPLSFLDLIKKNARSIDPLFVISLIRQESGFNPNASSVVGATGLMQLMPATARRYNKRVKTKHLVNPEINISIGTKYLKDLLQRYEGNIIFSLAAYNAGENRVDRWRKEIFKQEDSLSTIETIPFEETRNYVKLIYRNYFFYSLLTEKSVLMIPIEDSFKVSLKR